MPIALAILALATRAMAQPKDPLAAARSALAGPPAREWVLKDVIVFMGAEGGCTQGDALKFRTNGQVVIESCIAGHMQDRPVPWALTANGVLDPILTFDGKSYLLSFHQEGAKRFMKLRQRGADPVHPTTDSDYHLSRD
jgi:hypothetical protein